MDKKSGQGLVEYALFLVLVAVVVIAILTLLGPQVGNVFSRITSGLNGQDTVTNTTNIPSQTASLTLVGGEPLAPKAKVEVGTIAVSGIPKQMSVDDTLSISATIKLAAPTITISSTLTETEQGWTVQPYYERIQVFPRMSASLFGAGFEIEPDVPEERRTDIGLPATWTWSVASEAAGDNRTLNLEVSVPVETYGIDGEKMENTQAVRTLPFSVRVVGKSGLSSRAEFLASCLLQLLGLGIFASVGAWLIRAIVRKLRGSGNANDSDQEVEVESNDEPENTSDAE